MGQLHRIVFTSSVNLNGEQELVEGVAAIIAAARRNNGALDVSSALALHAGCFAQVIEGAETAVEAVFDRVRRDGRHRDVVVLCREAAGERLPRS